MSRIVRVNIYNTGRILGIKTPVYNFPLDYETFKLFVEMGINVELYKSPVKKEETVHVEPKQEHLNVKDEISVETTQEEFESWATKDVYTKDELMLMTKEDLIKILHYRGHYSFRTGKRDTLAPKYDDNKTILSEKILKTNKAE